MNIRIHFDGACNNKLDNPPIGMGVAVFIDNKYDEESSLAWGRHSKQWKDTSNVAEWLAAIEALRLAQGFKKVYKGCNVEIVGDSQVICYQFSGKYQIKHKPLRGYYNEAHKIAKQIGIVELRWVVREENKEADKLSKLGLQQNAII